MDRHEELLELLYLLPVGLVEFEAGGRVTIINPLLVRLLTPIVGHEALSDAYALLAPVLPDLAGTLTTKARDATGPVASGRRTLDDGNGTSHVVEVHVHRSAERFVAVMIDVTSQAEAQRRLRVEEARYEAIVKSVQGYGICSIDTDGLVNSWNESASRFFGLEDGVGRSLDDIVPLDTSLTGILRAAGVNGWQRITSRIPGREDDERWLETLVSRIDDDEVTPGFVVVSRDRTEEHRHQQHLEEAASTDPLTGLANRRGFERAHEQLRRATDRPHAMFMLDLDHFKAVNDTHGHDVGDAVLVAVAETIRATIRHDDVAGRLGGEEFAVFLPGATPECVLDVAERVRTAIEARSIRVSDDVTLNVTASIGVCTDADSLDGALAEADDALYEAKESGRNRVVRC